MNKLFTATLIFILSLSFASKSHAQVYNCDGIYRNIPCDSSGTEPKQSDLQQDEKSPGLEIKKEVSQKKSLIHDLDMKVFKANREYKINFNTSVITDFCLKTETSLEDCAKKIDELDDRIDKKITGIENIKAQKKANEIEEQKLKQDKEKENVTIIREYIVATPTFRPPYYVRPTRIPPPEPTPIDKLHSYGPNPKIKENIRR